MPNAIVIFVTAGSKDEARKIGKTLVEEELVACCNIVQSVESLFKWQGKVTLENEILLIIKTREDLFLDVEKRILQLHSYEVPEIISLPITHGTKRYLDWLREETKVNQ
ncbi:MAG: divalent-cation tolerance protein CutA [Candidatus Brocadiaceae bacterium]|nr:divalent-cation tolerance protein CutA [Candidatus Brocadiaceae bacterium]